MFLNAYHQRPSKDLSKSLYPGAPEAPGYSDFKKPFKGLSEIIWRHFKGHSKLIVDDYADDADDDAADDADDVDDDADDDDHVQNLGGLAPCRGPKTLMSHHRLCDMHDHSMIAAAMIDDLPSVQLAPGHKAL